jgi:predicted regulator of Ras-like GTPase activity (Roadblock/LC7/MglB family)
LERVFAERANAYRIEAPAGPDAVLAAVAGKDAKLGLMFLHVGLAAEGVKEAMVR